MKTGLFDVWLIHYATYEEVAKEGDIPPLLVARRLTFEAAQAMVDRLGFGHCIKPSL